MSVPSQAIGPRTRLTSSLPHVYRRRAPESFGVANPRSLPLTSQLRYFAFQSAERAAAVDAEPVGERPVFFRGFPVGWYWDWFSRARVTLSRFYIWFFLRYGSCAIMLHPCLHTCPCFLHPCLHCWCAVCLHCWCAVCLHCWCAVVLHWCFGVFERCSFCTSAHVEVPDGRLVSAEVGHDALVSPADQPGGFETLQRVGDRTHAVSGQPAYRAPARIRSHALRVGMVGQHEKRAEIRVLDVRRYTVDNPCQRLDTHDSSSPPPRYAPLSAFLSSSLTRYPIRSSTSYQQHISSTPCRERQ